MNFLSVFLIVAIIMAIALTAMALGVLFGRNPIRGSCGGLGNSKEASSCSMCSNRDTCSDAVADQTSEEEESSAHEESSDQTELHSERIG
jgi:uncharacterized protein